MQWRSITKIHLNCLKFHLKPFGFFFQFLSLEIAWASVLCSIDMKNWAVKVVLGEIFT